MAVLDKSNGSKDLLVLGAKREKLLYPFNPDVELERMAAAMGLTIVVIALIVNSLVIVAFVRDVRLQVVFNFYVFHMAVTDIAYCLLVFLRILYEWFHLFSIYDNPILCMILTVASTAIPMQQLSVLHMMARDRHKALKRGLQYRRKRPALSLARSGYRAPPASVVNSTRSQAFSVPSLAPTQSDLDGSYQSRTPYSVYSAGSWGQACTEARSSGLSQQSVYMASERVRVYFSWMVTLILGFFFADTASTNYDIEFKKCKFPVRFLYVHNTSYIHAALLCTLIVCMLWILHEYRRRKDSLKRLAGKPSLCRKLCPCLKSSPDAHALQLYCLDNPNSSTCQLVPRSPVEFNYALDNPGNKEWFDLSPWEREGSSYMSHSKETSIDLPENVRRSIYGHQQHHHHIYPHRHHHDSAPHHTPRLSQPGQHYHKMSVHRTQYPQSAVPPPAYTIADDKPSPEVDQRALQMSLKPSYKSDGSVAGLGETFDIDFLSAVDDNCTDKADATGESRCQEVQSGSLVSRLGHEEIQHNSSDNYALTKEVLPKGDGSHTLARRRLKTRQMDVSLELTVRGVETQAISNYSTAAVDTCKTVRLNDANIDSALAYDFRKGSELYLSEIKVIEDSQYWERAETPELHRTARVFSSIDKFCVESEGEDMKREGRDEKLFEPQKAQNRIRASSRITAARNDKDRAAIAGRKTALALPTTFCSDDELAEDVVTEFAKVRTDSLSTLRSCLSTPEESLTCLEDQVSSRDASLGRHLRSDSPAAALYRRVTPGPAPKDGDAESGSSGVGLDKARRFGDGVDSKSALFTIGDGQEELDEEEEPEQEWQGWDNLFWGTRGCDESAIISCRQSPAEHKSGHDTHTIKPSDCKTKKRELPVERERHCSDSAVKEQLAIDSPVALLFNWTPKTLTPKKKPRTPKLDNNMNKNDSPESYEKLEGYQSSRGDVDRQSELSALQWRLVKRLRHTAAHGRATANRPEEHTAAKYKTLLERWTRQSWSRKHKGASSRLMASRKAVQNFLMFYQAHCRQTLEEHELDQSAQREGSRTSFSFQNSFPTCSKSPDLELNSLDTLGETLAHDPPTSSSMSTTVVPLADRQRSQVEVEEEADSEDGLITAKDQGEIDRAVKQWLAFYDVNQPAEKVQQNSFLGSSELPSPSNAGDSENLGNEHRLPQLRAVGRVNRRDLITAREAWFRFYNVKVYTRTRNASGAKSSDFSTGSAYSKEDSNLKLRASHEPFDEKSTTCSSRASSKEQGSIYLTTHESMPSTSTTYTSTGFACNDIPEANSKGMMGNTPPAMLCCRPKLFNSELSGKLRPLRSEESPQCFDGDRKEDKGMPDLTKAAKHNVSTRSQLVKNSLPISSAGDKVATDERTRPLDKTLKANSSRSGNSSKWSCLKLDTAPSPFPEQNSGQPEKLEYRRRPSSGQCGKELDVSPTRKNRSLPCLRSWYGKQETPPAMATAHLTNSSSSSFENRYIISQAPPCSLASKADDTVSSEADNPTVFCESGTGQGSLDTFQGPSQMPSDTDLPRRMLETLGIRRRALLSELGLYHDFLMGLIPLDWIMTRDDGDVAHAQKDIESGLVGNQFSKSSGVTAVSGGADPEMEAECPYCQRRIRDKHAVTSQSVKEQIRNIFGIPVAVSADECQVSNEEEKGREDDDDQAEAGAMRRERMVCFGKCSGESSTRRQAASDGETREEGKHTKEPRSKEPSLFNNSNSNSSSNNNNNNSSNKNNNTTMWRRNSSEDTSIAEIDRIPPMYSSALESVKPSREKNVQRSSKKSWLRHYIDRASFQMILLKDPSLALVVSMILILASQFVCWVPRTALYVYYDISSFPALQSRLEIGLTILWYARLIMTPCVYLYYSRGFRENFAQVLTCKK